MKTIADYEYQIHLKGIEEGKKAARIEYNRPQYFGRFSEKHLDWAYYGSFVIIGIVMGITWISVMRFLWSV